ERVRRYERLRPLPGRLRFQEGLRTGRREPGDRPGTRDTRTPRLLRRLPGAVRARARPERSPELARLLQGMSFAVGLPVGSDGAADPPRKGANLLGSARERPPHCGARLSGVQRHGARHPGHERPGNLLGFDRRFGGRGARGIRRGRHHHPPRASPGRLDGCPHSPRGRLCKSGSPGQRGM
ncbi:MAG: hypothetical protein AVDCRST_MAG80-1212, partial [uncultured Rubrobacteraceae bacterium]